jgi:hypothetical protein
MLSPEERCHISILVMETKRRVELYEHNYPILFCAKASVRTFYNTFLNGSKQTFSRRHLSQSSPQTWRREQYLLRWLCWAKACIEEGCGRDRDPRRGKEGRRRNQSWRGSRHRLKEIRPSGITCCWNKENPNGRKPNICSSHCSRCWCFRETRCDISESG